MPKALKDTLNLPVTNFPMRGNLAKREPIRFKEWEESNLYEKTLDKGEDAPEFILHDGPPYANGDIHMGHALNKILKDFVIRYQSMMGNSSPYVPGWDCHGLPIEQQILKKMGDKIHDMEPIELRKLCHEYALGWIDKQREQFKRLGILGDWDNPYMTVSRRYEVGILKVLHALAEKNLIKKGHKAVHWDPVFRTALAEAEIEYHSHTSPSIYVGIGVKDHKKYDIFSEYNSIALVIWTTTPWTMPANMGVSMHPEFEYVIIRNGDNDGLVVAKDLADAFIKKCEIESEDVSAPFQATELDKAALYHPVFDDKEGIAMLGEHVTLEQGTGCVHTAPGHGADDFIIGQQYGLEVFCPVDNKGCYTEEVPEFEGQNVFAANPAMVEFLKERGILLGYEKITHEYPYSWRSKKPIIFRATEQWFMELAEGGVREQSLEIIDSSVEWIPEWGRDRIRSMVERRPEWCISRQRHWGVPIPAVRDLAEGKSIISAEVIAKFIDTVTEKGTDAWYTEPVSTFLPDGWDPTNYEKEFDILDVWFDSGASHVAVLELDEKLSSPADLYLEGSDQHRGWFQHALLTAVGAREAAPFKAVLTHGFVLDGKGKAMSKSMGNVISPLDLIKKYGSDILRLWVASTDYRNDVAMSEEIVKITADTYRTIRNTFRFQIGNLYDFNFDTDAVELSQLTPLDKWALHKTAELIENVSESFKKYEFHKVYQEINRFYTTTLSAIYHDILKDRLYTYAADSQERRSAQTVIHYQLDTLVRMLAPVLVYTCDEAWAYLNEEKEFTDSSIHTEKWPSLDTSWKDAQTMEAVGEVLKIRDLVNEKLEVLRSEKVIGKSIEAALEIKVDEANPLSGILKKLENSLPEIFIVSKVSIVVCKVEENLSISVQKAEGVRCPRCWRTVNNLVNTGEFEAVCERCAEALN